MNYQSLPLKAFRFFSILASDCQDMNTEEEQRRAEEQRMINEHTQRAYDMYKNASQEHVCCFET